MGNRNDYINQAYDIAGGASELERLNLAHKLCETIRPMAVLYAIRWVDRAFAFFAGAALAAFVLVLISPHPL